MSKNGNKKRAGVFPLIPKPQQPVKQPSVTTLPAELVAEVSRLDQDIKYFTRRINEMNYFIQRLNESKNELATLLANNKLKPEDVQILIVKKS